MQTHVVDGCVDKGSSIVADIIDLGTANATCGLAAVAVESAISGAISGLGRGQEVADEAGEGLRHLIGKRHHAS